MPYHCIETSQQLRETLTRLSRGGNGSADEWHVFFIHAHGSKNPNSTRVKWLMDGAMDDIAPLGNAIKQLMTQHQPVMVFAISCYWAKMYETGTFPIPTLSFSSSTATNIPCPPFLIKNELVNLGCHQSHDTIKSFLDAKQRHFNNYVSPWQISVAKTDGTVENPTCQGWQVDAATINI